MYFQFEMHVYVWQTLTLLVSEPRVRAHGGIKYELFEDTSYSTPNEIMKSLEGKTPLTTLYQATFKAPPSNTLGAALEKIGNGKFQAKLSGYFYPPITG